MNVLDHCFETHPNDHHGHSCVFHSWSEAIFVAYMLAFLSPQGLRPQLLQFEPSEQNWGFSGTIVEFNWPPYLLEGSWGDSDSVSDHRRSIKEKVEWHSHDSHFQPYS